MSLTRGSAKERKHKATTKATALTRPWNPKVRKKREAGGQEGGGGRRGQIVMDIWGFIWEIIWGINIGNYFLGINIGNRFLRFNIGNGRVSLGVPGGLAWGSRAG